VKFDDAWEQVLEAFVLVVAAVGAWLAWSRARRGAVVAGALAALSAGIPLLLAVAGEDYLDTRNVIAACLPFLVVVAAGFASRRRAIAVAAVGALCAVGVVATAVIAADGDYQRSNFRGSAEALGPLHGPRAVVVASVAGEVAMQQYLPGLSRMPPGGASVAEVALVTPRSSRLSGPAVARPRVPPVLPRPFALVERRYEQTYTLVRYRAPRPVLVKPDVLARAAVTVVNGPTVLVQR
jgi:hypothetical protein